MLPESEYPKLTDPIKTQGDTGIITDLECPFQHSDFVNRVFDLAYAWKIPTLHLGGDVLHNNRLSAWGAEWEHETTNKAAQMLEDFMMRLPTKYRGIGLEMVDQFQTGGQPDEIQHAREVLKNINQFDTVVYGIGNHDDRYMRALDTAMNPRELLVQIEKQNDTRWKIAPYYYSMVETEKGLYRIEHPKGAGRTAAQDLAVQYHCHIIMGHSHRWSVNRDPSGDYWAIQTGHCVDEERLSYVMGRSAKRDAHMLGATIIRGGYPHVLCPDSPFETMKRW